MTVGSESDRLHVTSPSFLGLCFDVALVSITVRAREGLPAERKQSM